MSRRWLFFPAPAGGAWPNFVAGGIVWLFDEGSGQEILAYNSGTGAREAAYDAQLGSTSGADASDPTWVTEGLSFDGSNDFAITSAFTVNPSEFHVETIFDMTSSIFCRICTFGFTASASEETITVQIRQNSTNDRLDYKLGRGSGNGDVEIAGAGSVLTGWHRAAMDYDSAGAGSAAGYLDGVLDGSNASVGAITTVSAPAYFGSREGTVEFFNGIIGGMAYYPFAFDAGQRSQNQAAWGDVMTARGVTLP